MQGGIEIVGEWYAIQLLISEFIPLDYNIIWKKVNLKCENHWMFFPVYSVKPKSLPLFMGITVETKILILMSKCKYLCSCSLPYGKYRYVCNFFCSTFKCTLVLIFIFVLI